jgi:hypothetical protein
MTEEFFQWVSTKRLYHVDLESLDGGHLPLLSKPTWSLVQKSADGSPAQAIGVLETSPDGCSARFSAEHLGTVEVTISAVVSPTAVATQTFKINVMAHPPAAGKMTLKVSSHRNGPIH